MLDLSYNSISRFPQSIIDKNHITTLYLFDNDISELPKLKDDLTHIDAGHNQIRKMPKLTDNLKYIELDFNSIEVLNANGFNLKRLSLQHNILKEITPSTSFQSLQQLDLRDNKLTFLPSNFAEICPKLKSINLSHNQISEYPKLPFTVTEIDLSFNLICELPSNFNAFTCLCRIYLQNNQIKKVKNIPSCLQLFNIINNNVSSFALNHVPDLTHLYLMGNNLEKFPQIKGNMINDYYFR